MEILGTIIKPNTSHYLSIEVAKLHNRAKMSIPVIVERGEEGGPVVLLNAGVHGDELNGVEIVRQIIHRKLNKPKKGIVICIPTLNVLGFINQERKFPDGRDLNRVFPGSANGSLASQFAYSFVEEIIKKVDYVIDFHTGGLGLDNVPQIRCVFTEDNLALAREFGTCFIKESKIIPKSLRATLTKMNIPVILFEGGKSLNFDNNVIKHGVDGAVRVLNYLGLTNNSVEKALKSTVIQTTKWLRARHSGMLHIKIDVGDCVQLIKKGTIIGTITGPYGNFSKDIKMPFDSFVFCINTAAIVNKGDAIFHLAKI